MLDGGRRERRRDGVGTERAAAPETVEPAGRPGGASCSRSGRSNYLTNYVVCHVPSFALRRLWYTRVLGVRLGGGAGIHLGCFIWFYGPGQLRRDGLVIGSHSRDQPQLLPRRPRRPRIGDNVSISPEVTILTAHHRDRRPRVPRRDPAASVIEDHVWIGTRATILPGVTLGRGSVVAAGAVVTRDVAAARDRRRRSRTPRRHASRDAATLRPRPAPSRSSSSGGDRPQDRRHDTPDRRGRARAPPRAERRGARGGQLITWTMTLALDARRAARARPGGDGHRS